MQTLKVAGVLLLAGCVAGPESVRPRPVLAQPWRTIDDFGGIRVSVPYPDAAAELKQEGWVLLEMTVLKNGCVADVEVADASPPGYFEEVALTAFGEACFINPKVVDGEPVEVHDVQHVVRFELD